jgi:hypothetical protein
LAFFDDEASPSSRTSEPLFLLLDGSELAPALTLFHESKGLALFGFFSLPFSPTGTMTESISAGSFLPVERKARPVGGGVPGV